ncbi:MAG: CHAT domain-containing protein [Methanoculleus bourgensis]|uniref:CHAT domain-containing protein n=1 Tax=Methanoculleus bourgensis TaxID=83986 RepID=UPI00178F678E|nr:CHAT domain-containing protein [Methanoculleus bourgensis]
MTESLKQEIMDVNIRALSDKAYNLFQDGRFDDAHGYLRKACALAESKYGREHPHYAALLCNLGWFLHQTRQGRESIHYCERAKEIFEKTGSVRSPEYQLCLNNLATIYASLGLNDRALRIYESLLQMMSDRAPGLDYATVLTNIGSQYRNRQQYQKAIEYLEHATTIYIEERAVKDPNYCAILNQIGLCYVGLKRYKRSVYYFSKALDLLSEKERTQAPLYLATLNNLALAYQNMGELRTAFDIYLQIYEVMQSIYGEDHLNITNVYDNLSKIYILHDNYEKAAELLINSSKIIEKYLDRFIGFVSETELNSLVNKFRYHVDLLFSLLNDWGKPPQQYMDETFNLIFRRKALVLDISTHRQKTLALMADNGVKEEFEQLKYTKSKIARMVYTSLSNTNATSVDYANTLSQLEEKSRMLEQNISYHLSDSYLATVLDINGYSFVQERLPFDALYVEYVRFNALDLKNDILHVPRYSVFVIERDKPIQLINLGPAHEIDTLIQDTILTVTGSDEQDISGLEKLSEILLSPISSIIRQKRNLIITPDGLLNLLPFGILKNEGQHLIDTITITYLTSARDLAKEKGADYQNQTTSVIIADPDYDLMGNEWKNGLHSEIDIQRYLSEALEPFERLEGTKIEGEEIHRIIGGDLWTGEHALKARLKRLESPKILHIATHGFFLPADLRNERKWDSLFRSGFVLAGANSFIFKNSFLAEAEDGIVTAYEVSELNLVSTDMVVLSACETGIGDILFGEGVFGFRRAFTIAGAKTLVMSLWAISDDETAELMVTFYAHLKAGLGRGEALREAQLSLKRKRPHPYYWGGFILQGAAGQILW